MRIDINIWMENDDLDVDIQPLNNDRIILDIGGQVSLFMDETNLDLLTDNILKAKLKYIKEGKNETTVS